MFFPFFPLPSSQLQGQAYDADGDLSNAYVFYKRFLVLAINSIPRHTAYSEKQYAPEKRWLIEASKTAMSRCEAVAASLDRADDAAEGAAAASAAAAANTGSRRNSGASAGSSSYPSAAAAAARQSLPAGVPTYVLDIPEAPGSSEPLAPWLADMPVAPGYLNAIPVAPGAPTGNEESYMLPGPLGNGNAWETGGGGGGSGYGANGAAAVPGAAGALPAPSAPPALPNEEESNQHHDGCNHGRERRLSLQGSTEAAAEKDALHRMFGRLQLLDDFPNSGESRPSGGSAPYPRLDPEMPPGGPPGIQAAGSGGGAGAGGGGGNSGAAVGGRLRRVRVPASLIVEFERLARPNTLSGRDGVETCGILAGRLRHGELETTTLILPQQTGTSDTCCTTDEVELFNVMLARGLITIGWVHTHPRQSNFLSSVDLHSGIGYQLMLPEAIAIVLAPTDKARQVGVYRLTPAGMAIVQACRLKSFHEHRTDVEIYGEAADVHWSPSLPLEVIDQR
ncbi:unnamed protein product [Phaeothamnion confervicola]